ncbi:MAG: 50S ribosomal protein L11 methyltransferase [Eubacteriales bacterium]
MAQAEWTKLTARGTLSQLETVCAVMSLLDPGLMIEDYSDFSPNGMYGELVDETILNADRSRVAVSLFVPAERSLAEYRAFLAERFASLGLDISLESEGLAEDDWAHSWKQYYHPIHIGRLSVVPAWENYTPAKGEVVVRMDPGMAFGTGTHESTRLVLRVLEAELAGGERFLDIGCGSGILSVCAARLGASFCAAYDIDPVAVRVAQENVRAAGLTNVLCGRSDLLASVDLSGGRYDFAVANIVSDIILRLLPDLGTYLAPQAKLVLSGIVNSHAGAVREALPRHGFTVLREEEENDWLAIFCRRTEVR